ncbi:hypothetical protein WJX79_000841 [Trebouxia sp. C0005]
MPWPGRLLYPLVTLHTPRRLGTGEVKRRMQQTTARSDPRDVAGFAAVPLPSDGGAQAYIGAQPRQLWQSLQPWASPLLATMCLLLLTMLMSRPASNDADQWQGSFASWEDASKQLQANEHEWAPPGAFAAALSTFKATLQDVTHSTNSLKKEHDMLASKHADAEGADYAVCQDTSARLRFTVLETQAFWRKCLAAVAGACSILCIALLLNRRWLLNRIQTMRLAIIRLQNQ